MDFFGVASARTIDEISDQLSAIRKDEIRFVVEDKNLRMEAFDPVVTEVKRTFTKTADLVSDAKSVIVLGMHYPDTASSRVGQPPAESVGPYVFTQLTIAGKQVTYLPVDANRCDWATKFALIPEEGNIYVGNTTYVPCPEAVTAENLAAALRQHDPVFKFRPVTGEKCIVNCPLHK